MILNLSPPPPPGVVSLSQALCSSDDYSNSLLHLDLSRNPGVLSGDDATVTAFQTTLNSCGVRQSRCSFSRPLPRLLSAVIILLFLFRLSLFLLLLKSNHPSASSHRATVDIAVAAATLRRLYDCIMDNDLPGYRALSSWRCDGSGRRFSLRWWGIDLLHTHQSEPPGPPTFDLCC